MDQAPVQARAAGDLLLYLVDRAPDALPSVRQSDLDLAWEAAHTSALTNFSTPTVAIRFAPRDLAPIEFALTDRSSCAWAVGVDRGFGLGSLYGLALLLRLLALVELATRATWLAERLRKGRSIRPDRMTLSIAARLPLSADARFDESAFRAAIRQPEVTV